MSGLVEFLLARIAEDERPHLHAKEMPLPGSEVECPCGKRGVLDGYDMTDGVLDAPLSITHAIGYVLPRTWGHDRGLAQESTHLLSWDHSEAVFTGMPMPPGSRRVLAECDAKRRIVAEHVNINAELNWDDETLPKPACETCRARDVWDAASWPCPTLRLLALPYADHPDYLPEWAPAAEGTSR